jgi:acetyltransferase
MPHPAEADDRWLLPRIGAIAIRPLTGTGRDAQRGFCAQLSREDLRLYFCATIRVDAALCRRLLAIDPARDAVFAACGDDAGEPDGGARTGVDGAIFGIARLARVSPEEAEIALIVRSDRKRRGLGRALLGRLVTHARALGLSALTADLLYENHPASQFVSDAGFVGVGPVGVMRRVRLSLRAPSVHSGESIFNDTGHDLPN